MKRKARRRNRFFVLKLRLIANRFLHGPRKATNKVPSLRPPLRRIAARMQSGGA